MNGKLEGLLALDKRTKRRKRKAQSRGPNLGFLFSLPT
jgi:hypothetical protein